MVKGPRLVNDYIRVMKSLSASTNEWVLVNLIKKQIKAKDKIVNMVLHAVKSN